MKFKLKQNVKVAIFYALIGLVFSLILFFVSFFIIDDSIKEQRFSFFEIGIALYVVLLIFIVVHRFNKKQRKDYIDKKTNSYNKNDFSHQTYKEGKYPIILAICILLVVYLITTIIHYVIF